MEDKKIKEKSKRQKNKKERVKEVHYHYYKNKKSEFNFGRFLFGLLIVVAGLLTLAQLTGFLNFDWSNLNWNLIWPVLIIIAGLSMLSRGGWVATGFGILVTIFVIAFVGVMIAGKMNLLDFSFSNQSQEIQTEEVLVNKETETQEAVLNIFSGAGNINIIGGSDNLVSGTFKSNFAVLEKEVITKDKVQEINLNQKGYPEGFFGKKFNELHLALLSDVNFELYIDSGASNLNLDLSDVLAQLVDIDTGASSINLILGNGLEKSEVNIDAGASSIKISLPKEIAAEVNVDSGLTSKELDGFNRIDDNTYRSENFATAPNRVDINLDLGVSSLEVDWLE